MLPNSLVIDADQMTIDYAHNRKAYAGQAEHWLMQHNFGQRQLIELVAKQ
jgi:hypothetical protein